MQHTVLCLCMCTVTLGWFVSLSKTLRHTVHTCMQLSISLSKCELKEVAFKILPVYRKAEELWESIKRQCKLLQYLLHIWILLTWNTVQRSNIHLCWVWHTTQRWLHEDLHSWDWWMSILFFYPSSTSSCVCHHREKQDLKHQEEHEGMKCISQWATVNV